jgi:cyanophycinase
MIGGAEDKGDQQLDIIEKNADFTDFEILRSLLPEKDRNGRLEVITTASMIPDEVRKGYEEAFDQVGFTNVGFLNIEERSEARDEKIVQRISDASTLFFSGGDQFRITTLLGGTPLATAMMDKYYHDEKFLIAGTSAGAMVMSKTMIMGGGNHEALFEADLHTSSGFGLVHNCIIDTHFMKRGRFGRLAHAVLRNPGDLGIGLGEDTALLVTEGNRARCLGSGTVTLIDGREIEQTNVHTVRDDYPVFVENLHVHLLVKNCVFFIEDGKIVIEDHTREED